MSNITHWLLDPRLHDYLSIVKGARNGFVYGVKVRFPHVLIMAILFGRGEYVFRCTSKLISLLDHRHAAGNHAFLWYIKRPSSMPSTWRSLFHSTRYYCCFKEKPMEGSNAMLIPLLLACWEDTSYSAIDQPWTNRYFNRIPARRCSCLLWDFPLDSPLCSISSHRFIHSTYWSSIFEWICRLVCGQAHPPWPTLFLDFRGSVVGCCYVVVPEPWGGYSTGHVPLDDLSLPWFRSMERSQDIAMA
jgi:hypothetical protein